MSLSVFITGVSSGIGYGLAKEYLIRGHTVLGISRRLPTDLLPNENFRFSSVDLCDETATQKTLNQLFNKIERIDIAILNAGVLGKINDLKDSSLEELRQVMETNVWSYKTVIDCLLADSKSVGKVITMSSGAAVNGNRGWGGYSISKAALNMLTMLYARECENTHFSAVAPGLVDTAMQDELCGNEADPKFPSLENLKSKRGTAEMPSPELAAKKLIRLFEVIENNVESGGFIDIRHLPEFNQN